MADENQTSLFPGNTPGQTQAPSPPVEQAPPAPEPISLGKLFPETKHDLDALFPDPQMKELLKEIHRNRQGNQRFLKRLNLSQIQNETDEEPSEP
jgi:hypothetical protein